MNYTLPPSPDDLEAIADAILESLPEELLEFCDSLSLRIEELADEALEQELDIDDPYELLALFRKGNQIAPGVESKVANDDDILLIFRRPLLDLWCETGDDLGMLVRQVMIEELGQTFDFSDTEIDDMARRHHQGML